MRTFLLLMILAWHLSAAERPNIIVILVDDMGYSGLGCFGNRHVATPHIDRLASQGVKLTQLCVTPQCTPTRASLLTGQHTARLGMWHVPGYHYPHARLTEPVYVEGLPRGTPTIANELRRAGYRTGCIGKWHLHHGGDGNYAGITSDAATHYGFDEVHRVDHSKDSDKGVAGLTDEAIAFIERQQQPFFLYLSHYTVHTPVKASTTAIARYVERGYPLAGPDGNEGRDNATYLAMIDELDQHTGRLLATLDRLQLSDHTLVIFLSDNGGVLRVTDNGPFRWGKGSPYEGGLRVPMIARWPGHIPAGTLNASPIHVTDIMPTILAAAKAPMPTNHSMDGINVLNAWTTAQATPERDLFFFLPHYEPSWGSTPNAVIRHGQWKLIEFFGDSIDLDHHSEYRLGGRVELYDLTADIGERTNLIEQHPERAAAMRQRLHTWITEMGRTIPINNPQYDASDPLRLERIKK